MCIRLDVSGSGSLASNRVGPSTSVWENTSICIESSGVIHGPLLPHQPGPLVMVISNPSRAASETAWANKACHVSLMNVASPRGGA